MSYEIVYNDERIVIDPVKFAANSKAFADIYVPDSSDVVRVRSDVPQDLFKDFLRAAQGEDVPITEENYEIMADMADQWNVPSLIERCAKFQESPGRVIGQLCDAVAVNDTQTADQLKKTIAENFDCYALLPEFSRISPKVFTDIMNVKGLNVSDWRNHYLAIMGMIENGTEKCSSLLNRVSVEDMTEEDIAAALSNPKIDETAAGVFMTKCARRLADELMKVRDRTQRRDQLERQIREKSDDIKRLRDKLAEEKQGHQSDVAKLNDMYRQYEPAKLVERTYSADKARSQQKNWRGNQGGGRDRRRQPRGRGRERGGGDPFRYVAPDD